MSELHDQIRKDLTAAMRAKEKRKVAALRMLRSAIVYEEREGARHELSDAEVRRLIAREIKKRRESAAIYADAGRAELAEVESAEADVLAQYLPTQLDDAALASLVRTTIADLGAQGMGDMGRVMKAVLAEANGQADGKRVSDEVKAQLGA
ncbi:GatB/YqeY domain-containing protein [Corynebacterium sp.]|uniref:GatB/YqeY domain-containing protein n=1 Tax=Corynebacterium sp. TaxID=1720 RepID=UPI0026DCFBA9|nr:GatB/YqeY domain-containing protein [Corynebacterium sp.]MDO5077757.1 GatB/YqeY domain-containing protein [Corynebacterium sp.]